MTHVILSAMKKIGNRLKLWREKLGLSQMELSNKSGISQASIARIVLSPKMRKSRDMKLFKVAEIRKKL